MFRYFLIVVLFLTWTYGAPRAYKKNSSIRSKDISYKILKRAQTIYNETHSAQTIYNETHSAQTIYNETHSVQSQTGFFNNSQTTQSTLDACSGRCSPNGVCWENQCYCYYGYVWDGFTCGTQTTSTQSTLDACSGRCSPNGFCWENQCYCYYGYVWDGFTCGTQTTSTQSTLGDTTYSQSSSGFCTTHYECHENANCNSGSCECFSNYFGDGKMCYFNCSSCLYSMCDGSRCIGLGTTTETIEVETTQTATTTGTTEEGSEIALSLNKIEKDLEQLSQSVERIAERLEKV